ncbi:hypothetical protein [Umezawaea sp. Da 62-37]|uniref:hypothetical protein n=1 Tax=Umezawaea sp. Da 62-37 TaxID=3075927 RepID=UPI0028F6DA52|nr:hypothetical protein [Umezawaea sp. Da 62-37]WNV92198.1 hypothetical protein RM788_44970 [Umezawaea sp. Da 62-37]
MVTAKGELVADVKVTGTPDEGNAVPSAVWRAAVTGDAIVSAAVSAGWPVKASRAALTTSTTALAALDAVHDPRTAVTT